MKKIILILILSAFIVSCNKSDVKTKVDKNPKKIVKNEKVKNLNPNKFQKDEYFKIASTKATDISKLLRIEAIKGGFNLKDEVKEIKFIVQYYSAGKLIKTQTGLTSTAYDDNKLTIGNGKFTYYIIDKSKTRIKTDLNTGFEFSFGLEINRKTKYGKSGIASFNDNLSFTKEEFDFNRFSHTEVFREKHYEGDILPIAYILGYGSDCNKCGNSSRHGFTKKKDLINHLNYKKEDYKLIVIALQIKK